MSSSETAYSFLGQYSRKRRMSRIIGNPRLKLAKLLGKGGDRFSPRIGMKPIARYPKSADLFPLCGLCLSRRLERASHMRQRIGALRALMVLLGDKTFLERLAALKASE